MPKSSKTKILATTFRKFSVAPLGKFKQDALSGDILPEANLVKNIFENVHEICWIASSLLYFIVNENIRELDPKIYKLVEKFQETFRNFSFEEQSIKSFTLAAHDVLLRIRNDKILKESVQRRFNTAKTSSLELKQSFLDPLNELMNYYSVSITTPFTFYLRSTNETVENIFLKEKYTKISTKLRGELEENLRFRTDQGEEKEKCVNDLEISIKRVMDDSNSFIQSVKDQTSQNIQGEIANSEGKMNELREDIKVFKSELVENTKEHIIIEDELRAYINRLEDEVLSMIDSYDEKMFTRHREIESILVSYAFN
uniref:Dynein regulatory complex protein 10 n=1 Tax=Lepeophtheirus salmonis TaxID=72036 RepID=A0A0K2TC37_LEPSM